MSYLFSASTHRLDVAAAPVTAYPLTLGAWIKLTASTAADRFIAQIGVSASGDNYHAILLRSDLAFAFSSRDSGSANALSANITDTTTWHFVSGVGISATSRSSQVDAANKGTNTTSRTPTGLNAVRIGRDLAAANNAIAARIAHVCIYNVALADADITTLAGGANPQTISGLVAYWPLTADANDVVGTNHLSVTGAALDGDNPTVAAYSSINWTQYRRRQSALICM